MKAEDVHSILFNRGTIVLMEEQPDRLKSTFMLNPVVNGKTLFLGDTQPWMFTKG